MMMRVRGVIRPAEAEMLHRVMQEHCAKFGIQSEEGRQSVAASLVALFQSGVTDDRKLAQLIEAQDRPPM